MAFVINLRILISHFSSDEVMKAGVLLGDVLEDTATRNSFKVEDCAFQRAHSVSVFNYYDGVRPSGHRKDSSTDT